jgi:hypothetical protein
MRLQEAEHQSMTCTETYEVNGHLHREEVVLFDVHEGAGADAEHNITADFLGKRYAVSRHPERNDRSLTVLALLSQLFALYRENKDLPKTSAVEVVGAR